MDNTTTLQILNSFRNDLEKAIEKAMQCWHKADERIGKRIDSIVDKLAQLSHPEEPLPELHEHEEDSVNILDSIVEDELSDVDSDLSDKQQQFLFEGESLLQLTKEVAAPYMVETGYIANVEVLHKCHLTEEFESGLGSASEIEIRDTVNESQNLHYSSCSQVFDPGILSTKDGLSCQNIIDQEAGKSVLGEYVWLRCYTDHSVGLSAPYLDAIKDDIYLAADDKDQVTMAYKTHISSVFESETSGISEEFRAIRSWSCFPIFDPGIFSIQDGVSCQVIESPLDFGIDDPAPIHVGVFGAFGDNYQYTCIKSKSHHYLLGRDLIKRVHYTCSDYVYELQHIFGNLGDIQCFHTRHVYGVDLPLVPISFPSASPLFAELLEPSPQMELVIGYECVGVNLYRREAPYIMQLASRYDIYSVGVVQGREMTMTTYKPTLELVDEPNLKFISGYVIMHRMIVRDYDGFNGPGSSQDTFNFRLALLRDYDGLMVPDTP